MLSESVAQNPIMPVSAGTKKVKNCPAFGWPAAKAEGSCGVAAATGQPVIESVPVDGEGARFEAVAETGRLVIERAASSGESR